MHPVPRPERTAVETEAQEEGLASSEYRTRLLTFIDIYRGSCHFLSAYCMSDALML